MRNFYEDQNIKRKVLIVEDEYINREILGNILMDEYEVDYACDGNEAWEKLAPSAYSLILLDLIMPVLSGSELLERIINDPNLKSIPVLKISHLFSPQGCCFFSFIICPTEKSIHTPLI